ncbi:MAG: glycogen/starch synthase [bacterium]|nr:glycogen/starch synthase [bacterium]
MSLLSKDAKSLKILFVASEAAPFVKVGGLGEVMHSLPKALCNLGHDARVFVPKYATIDMEKFPMKSEIVNIKIESGDKDPNGLLVSNVVRYDDSGGATTYFLENMEYYEKRANVYGYGDDAVRWVLLSKGALEFVKRSEWKPDVIVASDWQTGFIANLAHTDYKDDPTLSNIPIIFSIHNLRHQGMFDPKFVSEMDFDAGQAPITDFFDVRTNKLNGMRRGIMYADVINTVSPTYAREILTEEFGEGLDKLLNERKSRLFGILNGINTESLNPETDKDLAVNYSAQTLDKRLENQVALQKQFGLPATKGDVFVVGMVGRMDAQKGFDIVIQVLGSLMENINFQFVIIGEGDSNYRVYFEKLKNKYPDRVGTHFSFDARFPRMIFGGADAVLIPSKFEPSGLVQMEAMRYGCIPIVRKVGGLADSVQDFTPELNEGTGFVFEKYDPFSLTIAIVRASELYRQKKEWEKLVKRAMLQDFSWEKSAQEYIKLFEMALRFHKEKRES